MIKKFLHIINRKFVKDLLWTIFATIIVGASGLIIQTIVGNEFLASGLGIYSQVMAIYSLFIIISGFGIELSTLKHTAEYNDNNRTLSKVLTTSQLLILFFSLITSLGLYLVSIKQVQLFSSPEVAEGIKYICPGIVFFALNRNSNSFLTGKRRMKVYSFSRSFRWIIILVLTVIFLSAFPNNINYLLLVYSIAEALLFLVLLMFTISYYTIFISLNWIYIHLIYGSKSILSRIISEFNSKMGILIVGYLIGNSASGIFSFISTFGQVLVIISSAVMQNFNPFFASNYAKKNISHINNSIKKLFSFILPMAIPIYLFAVVGFLVYTNIFMNDAFKDDSIYLFSIFCIGILVNFSFGWVSTMLPMAGQLNINLLRIALVFIFNIISLFTLTYYLGLYGAVIAASLAFVFQTLLSIYFVKRHLHFNIFNLAYTSFKQLRILHVRLLFSK